jgi:nucleoside-diphosphate-sugar epimerase
MRIFVTGGSGFVGGTLVRHLVTEGHQVTPLARSEASAQRFLVAGAEPVRDDLADLADAAGAGWLAHLADVDVVVHTAAHMEFWGPDALFERLNHAPTVALHAAAVAAGVRRFVLVSAASVSTGSQRRPVVDETTPERRPNIAYSRVKLATERALLAAPAGTTELMVLPPFIWGRGMATSDGLRRRCADRSVRLDRPRPPHRRRGARRQPRLGPGPRAHSRAARRRLPRVRRRANADPRVPGAAAGDAGRRRVAQPKRPAPGGGLLHE